ncbi:glycosyltransferase involved in cell wall biosynthesis [Asanoa ferruginea]|uniref:Glycosyltransferase involved in cell wall biosynthesis n=1 Tax=Asanoa ferruginea TaxID=53367 RepID=A0A3D9ZUG5_9ACTN|nr:glycosyltransferase [Asanoa ferruginea]REG00836.1 glycosyltransferase involved in cell wall biosynthesis [Asanoa ferruginea]GIF47289.1 glycosyl transferase [Asanoa ferruginea]
MRIAHVTDVYLPRLGGIELQVRDLAARQRAAGHDTVVVTTTAGPHPLADSGDPPVVRLDASGAGFGPYRVIRGHALARSLAERRVDAVHVHLSAFSPLSWAAARVAAGEGLPTVVSVHSMWHDIAPIARRYARWQGAGDWPVAWAAVSSAAAGAVREVLDGAAVAVLPNGIDPDAWLLPAGPAGDVPTVVSVLRMVRRKRPRELLRALLTLHASHPGRFRAVLVGDGPLLPRLRRDLDAAGVGGVELTGALDRTEIRTLLAGADLYLSPAPRESFGIAALEARSAGLPVIARAGTGVADFIHDGVEGWLVDSDDGLIATVAALLDDPGRLSAVAAHNRAVAPRVHWQSVLDRADALYADAARRQGRLLGELIGSPA